MMQKDDDVAIVPVDGGQLGVLPFRGNDLSRVVLVPEAADGLPSLADAIGRADAVALGTRRENPVMLPKFTFEAEIDLVEPLRALGITSAFSHTASDLSGIDGTRELFVQAAVHKAVIAVDEEGAEAAVGIVTVSSPPALRVDRPFVFFIYDRVTHSILFRIRADSL